MTSSRASAKTLRSGPMSILIKRGVSDVESQVPRGHPRRPGELDGLVRIPERLLAQPDRPSPRRSSRRRSRWRPPRRPARSGRSRRAWVPPRIGVARRFRIAAAHSPKFQAVTVPTTAANWWLFRVACQLRALKATKSSNRNGLSRQARLPRPGSSPAPSSEAWRPWPTSRLRSSSPPARAFGLRLGRGRGSEPDPDGPAERDQEAQRAQDHRRQVQLQREVREAGLLDEERDRRQLGDRRREDRVAHRPGQLERDRAHPRAHRD